MEKAPSGAEGDFCGIVLKLGNRIKRRLKSRIYTKRREVAKNNLPAFCVFCFNMPGHPVRKIMKYIPDISGIGCFEANDFHSQWIASRVFCVLRRASSGVSNPAIALRICSPLSLIHIWAPQGRSGGLDRRTARPAVCLPGPDPDGGPLPEAGGAGAL